MANSTIKKNRTGATEAAPQPPNDHLVRAGRVANAVKLEHVRFVSFTGQALNIDLEPESVGLVPHVRFTRPEIRRDGAIILVLSSLVFSASPKEGDEPLASLRTTVQLKYEQKNPDETISDEDLRAFADVNVPFNSWGYWREFVQSGMARLGLPAITIPLFKIQVTKEWMIDKR